MVRLFRYETHRMKYPTVFMVMIALSASSALAAKKKPDVYSATEDTPSEEVIQSAPGYSGAITPEGPAPVQIAPISTAKATQTPKLVATAPQAPTTTTQYDSVPSTQAEPLVRRLRLTEELITKYGRAYDYRAYTVTQLQAILGQLDSEAAKVSELQRRMSARAEIKKTFQAAPAEEIPAPESTNSIGSEAPESAAPFQSGISGAGTLPPSQSL